MKEFCKIIRQFQDTKGTFDNENAVLLGYDPTTKLYKVYIPETEHGGYVRHVVEISMKGG